MRTLPLLLLPLLATAKFIRRDADELEDAESTHLKLDQNRFVVREGEKFMIKCVYEGNDLAEMADLKWLNTANASIDGESKSSTFTVALHESGTHFKKKNLHFTQVNKRDEGNYTCLATNVNGVVFRKNVEVFVINAIKWKSTADRVGGLVGDPLTVDCGVTEEDDDLQIQIRTEAGEPLDDAMFNIAGTEVSIASLTKEYNGFKITCNALQNLDRFDDTHSVSRTVTIDAWYAPEFGSEKIERHAILGRSAILHCNVTSSNPATHQLHFYRNDQLLEMGKGEKYTQTVLTENASYLKINNVQEDDIGEYECRAWNGQARGTQKIVLKQANPPEALTVALVQVKKHGLVWRIETSQNDVLPVERIELLFIRTELLNEQKERGEDEEDIWSRSANRDHWSISPSHVYDIGSLKAHSEYAFRFRAESEAGYGEKVMVTASTMEEEHSSPLNSASPFTLILAFLSLFVPLIMM